MRKRIGNTREPWGIPVTISRCLLSCLSITSCTFRSVKKEPVKFTRLLSMSSSIIRLRSCLFTKWSKALFLPIWNLRCQRKKNPKPLENLIEKFGLFINNESRRITRSTSQGVSIIDLALSIAELGLLTLWEIFEQYLSLSDHELILLQWEDISYNLPEKTKAASTSWDIESPIQSPEKLQLAFMD